MATSGSQWVVWVSDPEHPGWDFWSASNSLEAAEQDVEQFCKPRGYQTFIQGPVDFPEIKRAPPKPPKKRHHKTEKRRKKIR